jgi:AcrR family transcriptional regulator
MLSFPVLAFAGGPAREARLAQATETTRKNPRQARARATVDAVLEAAAQLLERDGEAGFNTNAVAERAGVSIGTLYRYFPDKRAILLALARREMAAHNALVAERAGSDVAEDGLAPDRAMIRAFLHAFGGRAQARRSAIATLLAHADPAELAAGHAPVQATLRDAQGRPLTPVQAFVVTRAVHGAMRAAVMEGADFLQSREFEDELVRLGRAYLADVARRACDGPTKR